MARLIANPFGEMSGKLGGIVFTKNKAGQIARVYQKGCTSQSANQTATRSQFNGIAKNWKNLVYPVPNNWSNFALNYYSPLKRTNHGQYSAYQSFVACQNAYLNSNKWLTTVVITMDGALGVLGQTQLPCLISTIPEECSIQPALYDGTQPVKSLSMPTVSLTGAGVLTALIRWIPAPQTGLTQASFLDPQQLPIVFTFYMSEVISNIHNFVRHPLKSIIASTGNMTITTPNLLLFQSKKFPYTGQIIQITACVMSTRGTQAIIGSKIITIV
jgi:hypothetical protein